MTITITSLHPNCQQFRLSEKKISKFCENILFSEGKAEFSLSLVLVDDKEMKRINHLYRQKDKTTNVLSFPFLDGADPALANLPIHELKIDQMFIRKMKDSCQAASLVKSILAIGNANSLRIVAEGVSDKEHVDWLKAHNCDLQQGYFFSKPLEIDALMNVYPGKGIADTVSLRKEKRRTQLG